MDEPLFSIEIQGLYDGVAVHVWADGRITNRFAEGEWHNTKRRRDIDAWIAKFADAIRTEHGLPDPEGQA